MEAVNHTTNKAENGLLSHIKVLDLSRILAGPWATQLLADYGASVWKVEKPGSGDDTRSWGPPFVSSEEDALSAYFVTANRGKRSICIDISQPEGQALIRQLVVKADVLVENYKVGGLQKYGLDYASLSKLNPKLIYCSITGFGQSGPMAQVPGYDAMIQATGGLMSITGEPEESGGGPQKVGVAVADLMTGMYATTAILAALNQRHISGNGQHIDLALLDTQIAMLANQGMNYLASGKSPERLGNAHPNIVPYQTFRCSDGYISLAVGNDHQFSKLCEVLEVVELASDEKYRTNQERVANRDSLIKILAEQFNTQPCEVWLRKLTLVKVPCGPVNNIQQAFAHPQVKHREMQFEQIKADGSKLCQIANPVKFSAAKLNYAIPPPALGQDTLTVLQKELELDEAQIEFLKEQMVIA